MTVDAPPGSPYHRLARTAAHRWWRPLAGTAAVIAGWVVLALLLFVVTTAAAALAGRPDGPDGVPGFGVLAGTALGFAVIAAALPVVVLVARWVQRRPAGTLSSVTGRFRWRWLLTCLPVAVVTVLLSVGGGTAVDRATGAAGSAGGWVGWGPFLLATAALLVVVPLQAAAEEFLFRGWLLQALGSLLRRPWVPIAVQAVLFAALHGWGTAWGFADLVVFGVLAGWLTVRTGGIEAAVALHVVNNLLAMGSGAALGLLAVEETAADAPWQWVAVDVPVLLAYTLVIGWLARRRGLATRTAADVAAPDVAVLVPA